MKTYPIPEGATHVLVADGPVSWIVPGTDGGNVLSTFAKKPKKKLTWAEIARKYRMAEKHLPYGTTADNDRILEIFKEHEVPLDKVAEECDYERTASLRNALRGSSNVNKAVVEMAAKLAGCGGIELIKIKEDSHGKMD